MKLNEERCHFIISGHKYEHTYAKKWENKNMEKRSSKIIMI